MTSYESIIFQLSSGIITKTEIPNYYLRYPEILDAIQKYNWSIFVSNIQGWTGLVRIVNYSS